MGTSNRTNATKELTTHTNKPQELSRIRNAHKSGASGVGRGEMSADGVGGRRKCCFVKVTVLFGTWMYFQQLSFWVLGVDIPPL